MTEWADLVTAVSALLGAVVWPGVILYVAIRYSAGVRAAIEALSERVRGDDEVELRTKVGGQEFEATFKRIAQSGVEQLVSVRENSAQPPAADRLALEASTIANTSLGLRAQIGAAHALVLDRLLDASARNQIPVPEWGRDLRALATSLLNRQVLSGAGARAVGDFARLTDLLRTLDEVNLTPSLVDDYVHLADALLSELESAPRE